MTPLFKKLNFKDQKEILVLHAPESFKKEIEEMQAYTQVHETTESLHAVEFIMTFVIKEEQINQLTPQFDQLLQGDGLLWFCYPKGTSKQYRCEFSRDKGWDVLGQHGFEGVRQVSVDEDWTALRFRRVDYIKSMTRRKSMAITKEGKSKTKGK